MERFIEKVSQRMMELKEIIQIKEKELENAPEGLVNVAKIGNRVQFYFKRSPDDSAKKYLKNKDKPFVKQLCQKDYDQKVLSVASKELKELERLIRNYPKESYEEIFDKINICRKEFVQPVVISDDVFVANWKQMEFQGKGFWDNTPEFYTDNDERVRSKSEILIANTLKKHGIPYKYEAPIHLSGYGVIHPDFTVLNVRLRKEIYWEHLGMVDNASYLEEALHRIDMYEKNGIFPGDKLILSHESLKYPTNTKSVEKLIYQYLK